MMKHKVSERERSKHKKYKHKEKKPEIEYYSKRFFTFVWQRHFFFLR